MNFVKKFLKIFDYIFSAKTALFVVFLTIVFPLIWSAIEEKNVSEIIDLIEMFTMVSATLAILSITYAFAKKKNETDKKMLAIGEDFFKATVCYIIGLIVLHFSINYFLEAEAKHFNTFIQLIKFLWFLITPGALVFVLLSFYWFCSGVFDVCEYFLFSKKDEKR